jgi:stearoyl-CoA desaturase (delta-9 desaturase)
VADELTLEALVQHRFELMAGYAQSMRQAMRNEIDTLKAKSADASVIQAARRWLHRDAEKVPCEVLPKLAMARAASPALDKMVLMREELRQMWLNRSHTREQLAVDLHAWCQRAEASGIAALQEFSFKLRAARA